MRDIVEFLTDTLTLISVPAAFQYYPPGPKGLPDQYVTFMEINANPDLEAGDVELSTERLIQINVWSTGNYAPLVEQIRTTLEAVGFERTFEHDAPYTDGDSHYNKVLRFAFFDEY